MKISLAALLLLIGQKYKNKSILICTASNDEIYICLDKEFINYDLRKMEITENTMLEIDLTLEQPCI